MIAYVKGQLADKAINYVVVDVGGVGYKIFMAPSTIEKLGEVGQDVKVYTYYYVREDNTSLYGFLSNEELRMFELLLSVSGIGAKSAITILSNINPASFILAVINNDVEKLTHVQGIGMKSAGRIVLELKDKLKKEQEITRDIEIENAVEKDDVSNEAIEALQVLGYNKAEIQKAIRKIDKQGLALEEIIKQALKLL